MDREAAVKLWREIGNGMPGGGATGRLIEAFATRIEAAERERCAKAVDHILREDGGTWGDALRLGPNGAVKRPAAVGGSV